MESYQVWRKIWEKIEKYVIPAIKNSEQKHQLNNFYWWGSRISGKTLNMILVMWKISELFPLIKFNFVWARDRAEQVLQTMENVIQFIPEKWLESQRKWKIKKNSFNKLIVRKQEKQIIYRNIKIQFVALQGKYNVLFKKGREKKEHTLLGYNFAKSDVRFIIFEEAYQTNKISRNALQLACRLAKLTFNFYLFNNYSKESDVVDFCEQQLKYDPVLLGEKTVTGIDSEIKNVAGQQEKINLNLKTHFWRLNFILLKKDNLLLKSEEEILWKTAKEDPSRAGTVLYGKCGIPRSGLYGKALAKIKWVEPFDFFNLINNQYHFWNDFNFFVGIDIGYLNDDSAICITFFDNNYKNLLVFDSAVFVTKERNANLVEQTDFFTSFMKKSYEKTNKENIKFTLIISMLMQVQLSITNWIKLKNLENKIDILYYKQPDLINNRIGFLQRKLINNKVYFLKTEGNKKLYDQMDGATLQVDKFGFLKRHGKQDMLEAFEYSCKKAINFGS